MASILDIFLAVWSSVLGAQAAGPVDNVPSPPAVTTPALPYATAGVSSADMAALQQGLKAVASGDQSGAEAARAQISDPIAQKILRWAEADKLGDRMAFFELDGARRDLAASVQGKRGAVKHHLILAADQVRIQQRQAHISDPLGHALLALFDLAQMEG